MSAQIHTLRAAGLQTYYQSLMEVPPGALLKANNTVINRQGVIEPRRGFKAYGNSFGTSASRAKQLLQYKGRIIRHIDDTLAFDDGTGIFTSFSGSYLEPSTGYRIKSVEAKSNLFFTTNQEVKKISVKSASDFSSSTKIKNTGCAKAISGDLRLLYDDLGFLPETAGTTDAAVAYRIVWMYTDSNDNLILGAPSDRMEISNINHAYPNASVWLQFQIPQDITDQGYPTDYKYRIYRSEIATSAPSDELYLVYEGSPTQAQITAKSISYIDRNSESVRVGGVPLYTNQYSGEGILNSNEQPPSAKDIALFKGHMFYGNTHVKQYTQTRIVSIDSFITKVEGCSWGSGIATITSIYPITSLKVGDVVDNSNLVVNTKITSINYSAKTFDVSPIPVSSQTNQVVKKLADIIISDGTSTNSKTYYFAGEKESYTYTFPAGNTLPSYSYIKLYSASNKTKYQINIYNTSITPVVDPGLQNDGTIYIDLSVTNATTAQQLSTGFKTIIEAIPSVVADFSIQYYNTSTSLVSATPTTTLLITNAENGISNDSTSSVNYVFVKKTDGKGLDYTANRALLSANTDTNLAIEQTARSLVQLINQDSTCFVTAYYISNYGDSPGKIFFQEKALSTVPFFIGSSNANIVSSFSPEIGSGLNITTKLLSTSDAIPNRLYYSKYQEHEAVPLLNYIDVGSKDSEISRIITLRDSLYILKKDGAFRLTGDPGVTPNWYVTVFDNTSIIQAPDTVVNLNNQCYYISNQGVVRLNEAGLTTISRPIEDKILPFITTNSYLSSASFSIPYESDRSLLVWTVSKQTNASLEEAQQTTKCYRYNIVTDTWTEWEISKTCGLVSFSQNKIYLGSGIDNYIEVERKNFDRFDYADRELDLSVKENGIQGNIIQVTNFSVVKIQDVLTQYQYVTLYQFNSLLKKLDTDDGLDVDGFFNELEIKSADNLNLKMSALVAKLNIADPTTNYSAFWTNPVSFQNIQIDFNKIIDALNLSSKTRWHNYKESSGYVIKEVIVIALDNAKQQITVNDIPSFLYGDLKLYKGIKTEIEYAPQHAGLPEGTKQFSAGTFMFERRSFYTATVSYNSDVSDNYEEIDFIPNSATVFGGGAHFGEATWGGNGDQAQIRTYVPMKKQRCRFLGCKFTHGVALESFQLYGLALSVRIYNIPDRSYK